MDEFVGEFGDELGAEGVIVLAEYQFGVPFVLVGRFHEAIDNRVHG